MWDDMMFKSNNCYKGERWLYVEGVLTNNSFNCVFCLVYGAHVKEDKLTVWKELNFISGLFQVPICYMDNFNEVVTVDEKKRVSILTAAAEDFRSWIYDMKLVN
ncbi:hypothetical protein AHAS_Ahas02G0205100 [Arachis hypogaea]